MTKYETMFFILGRLSLMWGVVMLMPTFVALWRGESTTAGFAAGAFIALAAGAYLVKNGQSHRRQLNLREAANLLLFAWLVPSVIGVLPFFLSRTLGFADAVFETLSFLTTTGINVAPLNDVLSLKVWCVLLAWLGGLNFLVLFVTLMPVVSGLFGVELAFRRGMNFSAVLGQMADVARQTFLAYLFITLLAAALFFMSGLSALDAVFAAMLTVSTTGDGDIVSFLTEQNPWPKTVALIVMLIVSGNILRYWRSVRRQEFRDFYANAESRFFLMLILAAGAIITMQLVTYGGYGLFSAIHLALFETLSFANTNGFAAANIDNWPDISKICLILLAFAGGCIGSPTGGIKIMRIIVLTKMLTAEARRTLHPNMISNIVVDGRSLAVKDVSRILSFFSLYLSAFFLFVLLLSLVVGDLSATVGMAAACFTNMGEGLGLFRPDAFNNLHAVGKLLCAFFMILSRVEIFAFLIFLQYAFFERRTKW